MSYAEPIIVNHDDVWLASVCESWCVMLSEWLCIMLCNVEPVVVNDGVLC